MGQTNINSTLLHETAHAFNGVVAGKEGSIIGFKMMDGVKDKTGEDGKVFEKDGTCTWKCLNCGYLHEGKNAPEVCPACLHPQSYFELKEYNY